MFEIQGYIDTFPEQKKGLLTTQLKIKDLLNIYQIKSNVNRDINSTRVSKISNYIESYDSEIGIYLPSIVLVAETEPITSNNYTKFSFPSNSKFTVLDGQHRIKALEYFINKEQNMNRLSEILESNITVQIYFGLNESSQRKLFSDINSRAKKVSQSLSFKFDERDVVNLLIKDLLKNNNTNTIHGLIIDYKSRIVRPQNKAWMSISRLNRFISYLLLNRVKTSHKTSKILKNNYFKILDFLDRYFNILANVIPDDPGNVRGSLLGHEALQNAIAVVSHEYIVTLKENSIIFNQNWQDILEHLEFIDWSAKSKVFITELVDGKDYVHFKDSKHLEVVPLLRKEWKEQLELSEIYHYKTPLK